MSVTEAGETGGPLTMADRLDEILLRLELWRPPRRLVMILSGALVVLVAAGWFVSRPTRATAVEDSIPMVDAADGQGQISDVGSAAAPVISPSGGASDSAGPSGIGVEPGPGGGSPPDPLQPVQAEPERELVVHVAGEVRRPGLVTLESGSRISDAVQAAGGPTAAADVHRLNLAAPVADGMQVRVPAMDEEIADSSLLVFPRSPSVAGDGMTGDLVVNINTAAAERLEALPGVGPAIAAAIVAWREGNGPFLSVEELEAVPGIGPSKLAALRDHATV